jgi:alkylated DNA repair dioxygenase AlkB
MIGCYSTNLKLGHANYWQHCCDTNDLKSFSSMRWSSLGYHYDWTRREYTAENKSPFPRELNQMASEFAKAVGYSVDAEAGKPPQCLYINQEGNIICVLG